MGTPGRFARGSLENHFAGASSTLGSLGSEAHSISRYQAHAGFQGEDKAAISKFHSEVGVSATRSGVGCSAQEGGEARRRAHHFGEDDEMFPFIQDALRKARIQAQERPVTERIKSTKLFLERKQKRVEEARQATAKAREVLAETLVAQEKEEALLADGERRLAELILDEKAIPSPFAAPPPVGPKVSSELSRMQGIIANLQRELARFRSVDPVNPTVEDEESMVADLPHKKSRVCPATPMAIAGIGAPRTPLAIMGGHAQGSNDGLHLC